MEYPEWASDKQKEGMGEILSIVEFGRFDISFKPGEFYEDEDHEFIVVFEWEAHNYKKLGKRHHEIRVCWDHQEFWDCYGERVYCWHFVFSDGDVSHRVSTEILFLDLFFYLDEQAITK